MSKPKDPRFSRRIRTLKDLYRAAMEKRSVIYPCAWRSHGRAVEPAAWVLNWQGVRIHIAIEAGLWIYKKICQK